MRGSSSLLHYALAILLGIQATGCSAELQGTQGADRARSGPAFSAPADWSYPPGTLLPTYGRAGTISTTDRVASEIGLEILRRGGNAIDAAVAAHFALAVVNPEAGNLGGGGFMIVHLADGSSAALDFRETAPALATRNMYLDDAGRLTDRSTTGHLASAVPGSVAGMWEAHRRYGSLPWPDLVQPAINLAEGMVVHDRLAASLQGYANRLRRNPAAASVFLPTGEAPRVGDRLVQADLAATLRRIAAEGASGFYAGATATAIVGEMQRGGGIISAEDLSEYRAIWRDPIRFEYRGYTIVSMPPPSSGGATLAELLNILEGYDLRELGHHSAQHVHLFAEAAKRAFADRNAYLADPDFVAQPIAEMISDEYAARRRSGISLERTTPAAEVEPGLGPPLTPLAAVRFEPGSTTHFSVLDTRGNAVALTTTLNSLYGSGIMVTGAGFLLNNVMDDFAVQPGTPNQFGLVQGEANAIAPRKRMLSAMTPTIVLDRSGRVFLVTGTPGGPTIITTVAQVVSNVVDFGMNVADALLAPRVHHQHLPDLLQFEADGVDTAVQAQLRARGLDLEERPGFSGDVHSILLLPDGTSAAAADPRRGGSALAATASRPVMQ